MMPVLPIYTHEPGGGRVIGERNTQDRRHAC